MALAEFIINEDHQGSNGAPNLGETVNIKNPSTSPDLQFRSDDTGLVDNDNPIAIDDAVTNYSFVKSLYLQCSVAPQFQVDDVEWFVTVPLSLPANVTVVIGDVSIARTGASQTAYRVATGTVGVTGVEMTLVYTAITTPTLVQTYDNAPTTFTVPITEAGSIIDDIGETTNYIILQMVVPITVNPAQTGNEFATYQYDEI